MVSGEPTNENAANVLRAVGSLLVALSGGQADGQSALLQQTLAQAQPEAVPPTAVPPPVRAPRPTVTYPQPQGRASTPPAPAAAPAPRQTRPTSTASDLLDDVEFVLQDARERAQAIIDESTERARELIRQERASTPTGVGIDTHAFDDLRRGLRNLVTEVRDIQQRLGRIEQLIRDQNEHLAEAKAASFVPPAFVRPQYAEPQYAEPQYAEPQYAEPQYAEPQVAEPQYVEPQIAEPQYVEPQVAEPVAQPTSLESEEMGAAPEPEPASEAPEPPSGAPVRSTFSVVPPQRREWTAAVESAATELESAPPSPAYDMPAAPPRTFTAAAAELAPERGEWQDEPYDDDMSTEEGLASAAPGSALVTFLPSDGAITLRVAPVAGFQGLMRIQDALTRLPGVQSAAVDEYSQGEVRLRLVLAEASDSDEIVDGLARGLRSPARVEDASEVNRELFITLR